MTRPLTGSEIREAKTWQFLLNGIVIKMPKFTIILHESEISAVMGLVSNIFSFCAVFWCCQVRFGL